MNGQPFDSAVHFSAIIKRVRRRTDGSWIGVCPAHDDDATSLTFSDGVVLECAAGCTPSAIREAAGIDPDPIVASDELPAPTASGSKREAARVFLLKRLGDGRKVPAWEVLAECQMSGIASRRTLMRAKAELGVRSERKGGSEGAWWWYFPAEPVGTLAPFTRNGYISR